MREQPHESIRTIDCHYVYDKVAAAYLLKDGPDAVFIENNTSKAVPYLLETLKAEGYTPDDVRFIIITHVHLDHAGGTAELLKHCPNATVLAHPRAARHVINPERLVKSAQAVYGEKAFYELYGEVKGISENRVRIMNDGETLELNTTELKFIYTEGHARHHFVIYDRLSNSVFTGDSFGIAYPALQNGSQPFLFATTTPTDFDYEEALKSADLITGTGADCAYLTHFGCWSDMAEGAEQLKKSLEVSENLRRRLVEKGGDSEALQKSAEDELKGWMYNELEKRGYELSDKERNAIAMDVEINAMGLVFTALKEIKKRERTSAG